MSPSAQRSEAPQIFYRSKKVSCKKISPGIAVEIPGEDERCSSGSQTRFATHHRSSSESSLISKFHQAAEIQSRRILELHNYLGLTAVQIARRFFFTFTENPAGTKSVLLTTNSINFPSPKGGIN
jgi:hypothetical protein